MGIQIALTISNVSLEDVPHQWWVIFYSVDVEAIFLPYSNGPFPKLKYDCRKASSELRHLCLSPETLIHREREHKRGHKEAVRPHVCKHCGAVVLHDKWPSGIFHCSGHECTQSQREPKCCHRIGAFC